MALLVVVVVALVAIAAAAAAGDVAAHQKHAPVPVRKDDER